jgi:hypothetical protein
MRHGAPFLEILLCVLVGVVARRRRVSVLQCGGTTSLSVSSLPGTKISLLLTGPRVTVVLSAAAAVLVRGRGSGLA